MRKLTRRAKILIAVVIVIGGALYYAFIDRAHVFRALHGWSLHHSHRRLACPTCTGRVEELTYAGADIGSPAWPRISDDASPRERMLRMSSPVGEFHFWDSSVGWFMRHETPRFKEPGDVISSDELARGYYPIETHARKLETPEHWCFVSLLMGEGGYWMSPEYVRQVSWSDGKLVIAAPDR